MKKNKLRWHISRLKAWVKSHLDDEPVETKKVVSEYGEFHDELVERTVDLLNRIGKGELPVIETLLTKTKAKYEYYQGGNLWFSIRYFVKNDPNSVVPRYKDFYFPVPVEDIGEFSRIGKEYDADHFEDYVKAHLERVKNKNADD